MTELYILHLGRKAVTTMLLIAAPALLVSLVVGLGVSIFQATTQIQEPTLTFVPKIIAVFLTLLIFGSWIMNVLMSFTLDIMNELPYLLR
jgi:flagellar biosynthesis protein FliQ